MNCNWIVLTQNWEECGEPATHQEPVTKLAYCPTHAAALGNCWRLEKLDEGC